MNTKTDYLKINRESWDARTMVHVDSEFYGTAEILAGKTTLNSSELALLGNIQDKKILHLQCHFGLDSISLSRMGASVTGVDFSEKAIEQARVLSQKVKEEIDFICSDVYELKLNQTFDIIFSSYGVIGWLPDMDKWAKIISSHLKHGGKFVFVEFHPVVWMFDNKFEKIEYDYAKKDEIIEEESGPTLIGKLNLI